LKPLLRARPKRARCGGPNVAYAWQTSRPPLAAAAVDCASARRAPLSEAALLWLNVTINMGPGSGSSKHRSCAPLDFRLYIIQTLVYFLDDAIWRSGYMVIGLLVLASVVAIAFDDDVAAAGLLAAAVVVSVGGF